jgi:hypothetical protein
MLSSLGLKHYNLRAQIEATNEPKRQTLTVMNRPLTRLLDDLRVQMAAQDI